MTLRLRRLVHWDLGILVEIGVLGYWLVEPSMTTAALAGTLAVGVVVGAARTMRLGPVLAGTGALVAAIAALDTTGRVRIVETAWPDARVRLVERANRELGSTLDAAVAVARSLAASGATLDTANREAAFRTLDAAVRRRVVPERGVVILEPDGRAWAWAGRHRLAGDAGWGPELTARMTPFYVVLEARRQAPNGRVVVGQVLLAADSAVPDRERSLAARFSARVGAGLRFFPPDVTPPPDGFYYCVPECGSEAGASDTLFSVRTEPPSQGTQKLALLAVGSRWTGILLFVALALLAVGGGAVGRWGAVAASVLLLVFTPAGALVGLANLFSSATFFVGGLGPVGASAGTLLATTGAVVGTVFALADRVPRHGWLRVAGGGVALAAVGVLGFLARGVTPPAGDVSIPVWLSWHVTLMVAGAALLVTASVLRRGRGGDVAPPGATWVAVLLAVVLVLGGLAAWRPGADWPLWFTGAWLAVAWLASRPAPTMRLIVTTAIVAGTGAALLTWSAAVRGRLLLAERDLDRLSGGDPVASGMLDQFVRDLGRRPAPTSAAELYARWRASPLSGDDYPAVLATWGAEGDMVAMLELAALGITPPFFEAYAESAREQGGPVTLELEVEPGKHYLAAVPFADGSVVTVAVAPRSQLIPPVLVARFLRGERRLVVPYQMFLGEVVPEVGALEPTEWRRTRWAVRGTRTVQVPTGARHVHVEVDLGDVAQLLVRGALLIVLDVVLLALLWLAGEGLVGRTGWGPAVQEWLRLRSYRMRLGLALAAFFVIPTVGFAVWSVSRLRVDAARTRDLVIQQTLRDAIGTARQFADLPPDEQDPRIHELADRLNADLLWYSGGRLVSASSAVLQQLGLLDRFLSPAIYRLIAFEDELEMTAEIVIGGQPTRVGYRSLGHPRTTAPVLAVPRLVDVTGLEREQEDLGLGLLLVTVLGLGGATGLAGFAARTLARPVQSLQAAAEAVGRGERIAPFAPDVPTEFVSVVEAFERMAHDVEASQAALEAARRRTAAVLAHVATGVVALDRGLRVVIANPRAEELFGVLLRSGRAVQEQAGAAWAPVWDWVAEFIRRGDEQDAGEFIIGEREIRVQVAALLGDPRGAVVALDDATELTRAVRVLAWGELARQIAHEIKNPLTPIRLGMQHLQRARRDGSIDFDSTLERTARQILAEIERLDAIARAFARFGAPPPTQTSLEQSDLVGIACDAAALYALSSADVAVEHDGPVGALVRKDEVKEVLINLIENARGAGATRVTIRVRRGDGGPAVLEVADDGRGIPREHLGRIFEPQFSTTTSGTGLGLAICRRLVESWGGTIEVESEEGRGTTVRIGFAHRPAAGDD